jgi:hypothetical protein
MATAEEIDAAKACAEHASTALATMEELHAGSIAAEAYGVPPGPEKILRMQWINNANAQCWIAPGDEYRRKWFPFGVVDLAPRFAADPAAALQGKPGEAFPVLRIPDPADMHTVSLCVFRWRREDGSTIAHAGVRVDGELRDGFYSPHWPTARRLARRVACEMWRQMCIAGESAHPTTRPRWERTGDDG